MVATAPGSALPAGLLRESLASGRVHSAYLLAGPGEAPRAAARAFVRALVCTGGGERPCEACSGCARSTARQEPALDGTGKTGPLYRHVGDHPDLLWVERGSDDTRVRIGQIRALQHALHRRSHEGGARAAVIADAEWLNQEAQNALLRLLEEPPERTTLVLVAASAAGLLTTLRSRCQRVRFPAPSRPGLGDPDAPPELLALAARFAGLARAGLPELLDWAEEYRGARGPAAQAVGELLEAGCTWLSERVRSRVGAGDASVERELEAFAVLRDCRRVLVQRNANPQMVAERALLSLRDALEAAPAPSEAGPA
jgi:DNA polymerase-3 subunit delta'